MKSNNIILAACTSILVACSSTSATSTTLDTTPTPSASANNGTSGAVGAAENNSGTYSVTQGDNIITLPAGSATLNGHKAWLIGDVKAYSYEDSSVLAIGGIKNDAGFGGITGPLGTAPTSGTVTYSGRFGVSLAGGSSQNSPLTMNVDFGAGTVKTATGSLDVTATIASDSSVSGTATFSGKSGNLNGGFYGSANTFAAAVVGNEVGGVVYAND